MAAAWKKKCATFCATRSTKRRRQVAEWALPSQNWSRVRDSSLRLQNYAALPCSRPNSTIKNDYLRYQPGLSTDERSSRGKGGFVAESATSDFNMDDRGHDP